jgi:hypothetical protein
MGAVMAEKALGRLRNPPTNVKCTPDMPPGKKKLADVSMVNYNAQFAIFMRFY